MHVGSFHPGLLSPLLASQQPASRRSQYFWRKSPGLSCLCHRTISKHPDSVIYLLLLFARWWHLCSCVAPPSLWVQTYTSLNDQIFKEVIFLLLWSVGSQHPELFCDTGKPTTAPLWKTGSMQIESQELQSICNMTGGTTSFHSLRNSDEGLYIHKI